MRRYESDLALESLQPPKFNRNGKFLNRPEAVLFTIGASESALSLPVLEFVIYSYKSDMRTYGDLDLFASFDCQNWCARLHESLDKLNDKLNGGEEIEYSPVGYVLSPGGAAKLQDIRAPAGGVEQLRELIASAEAILSSPETN